MILGLDSVLLPKIQGHAINAILLCYIHHYFSTLNHSRYRDMHPDAHLHVLSLLLPFHFPSPGFSRFPALALSCLLPQPSFTHLFFSSHVHLITAVVAAAVKSSPQTQPESSQTYYTSSSIPSASTPCSPSSPAPNTAPSSQ